MTEQAIAILVVLAVLAGLTWYIGSREKTGIIQITIIAFLGYCAFILHEDNPMSSAVICSFLVLAFYLKSRTKAGKRTLPSIRSGRHRRSRQRPYPKGVLNPFVTMLNDFNQEQAEQKSRELKSTKEELAREKREKEALEQQNELLHKKQKEHEQISQATPRLRYYNELAKRRIDQENAELAKLREKRLQEELRRQKDENRNK